MGADGNLDFREVGVERLRGAVILEFRELFGLSPALCLGLYRFSLDPELDAGCLAEPYPGGRNSFAEVAETDSLGVLMVGAEAPWEGAGLVIEVQLL